MFVKNFDEYKASGWDATMRLLPADTLCDEYKPEDVWIGHSYFLMRDEEGVDNTRERILYELIPTLRGVCSGRCLDGCMHRRLSTNCISRRQRNEGLCNLKNSCWRTLVFGSRSVRLSSPVWMMGQRWSVLLGEVREE